MRPEKEPELRSARGGEDDEKRSLRTHTGRGGGHQDDPQADRLKRATTCTI